MPPLHRLRPGAVTATHAGESDLAPCPQHDPPGGKVEGKCDRSVAFGLGRHYEVFVHEVYRVPVLRVTLDAPWRIDDADLLRFEFFKYTRESALATKRRAEVGELPHGRNIDLQAHYFVSATRRRGDADMFEEETHSVMLSIVPVAFRGPGNAKAHSVRAFGSGADKSGGMFEDVAIKIITENPLAFFDLPPEPTLSLQTSHRAPLLRRVLPLTSYS